jgi:hypothetical protein
MDTLYINDERLASIRYVGTREEWKHCVDSRLRGWYNEYYAYMEDKCYHQEPFSGQPMSYEDWVEERLDECLSVATGYDIERYDRLTHIPMKVSKHFKRY